MESVEMEAMFVQAEREGKWFWTYHQDMWFSPRELRVARKNGHFKWGTQDWRLRDPNEAIEEYTTKIEKLEKSRARFIERMEMES